MGDTPQTENKLAKTLSQILKKLIEGVAEDAVVAAIIVDYPWMPKTIVQFIVGYFGKYFYIGAAEVTTNVVINVQAGVEKESVKLAFSELDKAIKSGDANAITAASKRADDTLASLIHWDGSFNP